MSPNVITEEMVSEALVTVLRVPGGHGSAGLNLEMKKEDLEMPRVSSDVMPMSNVNGSSAKLETWAVEVPAGQSKFPEAALFVLQQAEQEGPYVSLFFVTVIENVTHEEESPADSAYGDVDIRQALNELQSDEWEREREREWEKEVTATLERLVATAAQKHVRAASICLWSGPFGSIGCPSMLIRK